jgi:hypothetical protein
MAVLRLHEHVNDLCEQRNRLMGCLKRTDVSVASVNEVACAAATYSNSPAQFWFSIRPVPSVVLSRAGSWNIKIC